VRIWCDMPHQLTKFITFTTNLSQPDQDQSFLFDALNLPRIVFQIQHIKVTVPLFFIFCVLKHLAAFFWYHHFLHYFSYYHTGIQCTCLEQETQPLPYAHLSWESKGGKSDIYSFWIFQNTEYLICDKTLLKTCMIDWLIDCYMGWSPCSPSAPRP